MPEPEQPGGPRSSLPEVKLEGVTHSSFTMRSMADADRCSRSAHSHRYCMSGETRSSKHTSSASRSTALGTSQCTTGTAASRRAVGSSMASTWATAWRGQPPAEAAPALPAPGRGRPRLRWSAPIRTLRRPQARPRAAPAPAGRPPAKPARAAASIHEALKDGLFLHRRRHKRRQATEQPGFLAQFGARTGGTNQRQKRMARRFIEPVG